ncbi:MAG: YggS family pyridoxal phosphate-dependent enzyme [Deltaproteobacteria bacterium]|nr:MAG: YggS family pyridoxal phosphate-dependent enzyme [Deltaproteobacteria bacterium]
MIAENLKNIHKTLSHYPKARLVCVTKSQPLEKISQALQCGERYLGANYSQELIAQSSLLAADWSSGDGSMTSQSTLSLEPRALHWHFIGHLQRNKVKTILPLVDLIHSVDSEELALEIHKRAQGLGKVQSILIEINLGNEESKTGMSPHDIEPLVTKLNTLDNIKLEGLMCIPPAENDAEKSRPYFRHLREIRDAINLKKLYKHSLTELSMGMSHDFEIALQEGATMIRIGTGIFGERHVKG